MSNGSRQHEDPRDVRCEHCGRCYRNDGIHNHERNCPHSANDGWVVPPEDWDEGDTTSPDGGDGATPPQDGAGVVSDPPQEARTDGGPMEPPAPTVVEDDQEDDAGDELPDRYVDVDEYIALVDAEPDADVDTDVLREELAEYDVVDVEETTRGSIAAYSREDV